LCAVTSISGHGLGALATLGSVSSTEITNATIADADISGTAAIATSKLSGALTAVSGHGLGSLATLSAVSTSEITDGTITNADIAATAAIDASKVANGSVSSTEFQYLDGLTSSVQTQLDAKASAANPTFTGAITADSGSAAAPPYSFTGDSNTGVWSSGADTVNLSTGGSERLRVTSTGNVGVGTPAPASHLEVYGSGNQDLSITTTATGANWAGVLLAHGGGTSTHYYAGDSGGGIGTNSNHSFALRTNTLTRLTVSADGNVGIGTTNPVVSLDLSTKTDALALPSGTTGQQPTSPAPGWLRYNSGNSTIEFYNGSLWKSVQADTSVSTSPPGMVSAFPMATCPTGWLEADGATVSRTTYASLFSAIGTIYGAGNGSTTFRIPDYRGYFLRGWSHGSGVDPDAGSRTNRGDGTTGDNIGTLQSFQLQSHTHNYSSPLIGAWQGVSYDGAGTAMEWPDPSAGVTYATGGNETRPKNVNVIYCISTATSPTTASGGSGSSNYIPLWTSSTILGNSPIAANNGNVGIGTTSPSYLLHVNGSVAGVGAYNQLSDARYKKDVASIPDSLEKVLAIHGVTYKWIDEEKYGSETQIGVIAQEIEKIVPEVVTTGSDGVKRVRYSDLVPLLIEAFKHEHTISQQLKAESEQLKAESEKLKAESEQFKAAFCSKFSEMPFCSR
jgi:hypothetical protein